MRAWAAGRPAGATEKIRLRLRSESGAQDSTAAHLNAAGTRNAPVRQDCSKTTYAPSLTDRRAGRADQARQQKSISRQLPNGRNAGQWRRAAAAPLSRRPTIMSAFGIHKASLKQTRLVRAGAGSSSGPQRTRRYTNSSGGSSGRFGPWPRRASRQTANSAAARTFSNLDDRGAARSLLGFAGISKHAAPARSDIPRPGRSHAIATTSVFQGGPPGTVGPPYNLCVRLNSPVPF